MLKPWVMRAVLGVAGGALGALAFDPTVTVLALPVGLAAWLVALTGVRLRHAALISFGFGLAHFLVLLTWVKAVAWGGWPALSAAEALFLVPVGVLIVWFRRHLPGWPLWAAAVWVAFESLRSSWPLSGLPWGRLSYAAIDTWWAPGVGWYGFSVVSALIFLSAAVPVWTWDLLRDRGAGALRSPAWGAGVLVVLALTLAPVLAPSSPETTGTARIAVVQGDVPGLGNDLLAHHRAVTQSHSDLTVELAERIAAGEEDPVDLVIWPENSLAVDPLRDGRGRAAIQRASDAIGVPILVGAMTDAEDPRHVLNQGIVWNPGTDESDDHPERYTKRHPVPFGEYIPLRHLLSGRVPALEQVPRDMLSGARETPLRIGDLRVANAICFDVAYDDSMHGQLRQGAQMAVVQTSNAMFIGTDQIEQQFEISRLRAIESGRWLAVAAVNGVSGIIRPDGTVAELVPEQTRAVAVSEVDLIEATTPAVRLGPWPQRLAGVVALVGLVLAGWRRRRSTPAP